MSSNYSPSSRRVTIYDVAARAGVSKSLVSLVLRGSPKVSPARREAVLAAVADLDYRPSRAAAALAGRRTGAIGVVIDDFRNTWFVPLLEGLREGLAEARIHVSVADRDLNGHRGESAIDGFVAARVDALVIAADLLDEEAHHLARLGTPVVVVGERAHTVPGADAVHSGEVAGAALAVDHLHGLGHCVIWHVTGQGGPAARRADGYRQKMVELGLTPRLLGGGQPTTEDAAYRVLQESLHRSPTGRAGHPSAVFAANDTMATGVLAALRHAGLTSPNDVSVIGFDNSPLAASHLVQLTTVDGRNADLGRATAQVLLDRLATPGGPPRSVTVRAELVVRTSSGPAPT